MVCWLLRSCWGGGWLECRLLCACQLRSLPPPSLHLHPPYPPVRCTLQCCSPLCLPPLRLLATEAFEVLCIDAQMNSALMGSSLVKSSSFVALSSTSRRRISAKHTLWSSRRTAPIRKGSNSKQSATLRLPKNTNCLSRLVPLHRCLAGGLHW